MEVEERRTKCDQVEQDAKGYPGLSVAEIPGESNKGCDEIHIQNRITLLVEDAEANGNEDLPEVMTNTADGNEAGIKDGSGADNALFAAKGDEGKNNGEEEERDFVFDRHPAFIIQNPIQQNQDHRECHRSRFAEKRAQSENNTDPIPLSSPQIRYNRKKIEEGEKKILAAGNPDDCLRVKRMHRKKERSDARRKAKRIKQKG